MACIDDIMRAHPEWPRRIRHGEYVGVLIDIQPLLEGQAAPIYRFHGGDAVGVDYEVAAVRVRPYRDSGVVRCGACGADLISDSGNFSDVCPACHEGVDWSGLKWKWKRGGEK